jgi:hypothetical protein
MSLFPLAAAAVTGAGGAAGPWETPHRSAPRSPERSPPCRSATVAGFVTLTRAHVDRRAAAGHRRARGHVPGPEPDRLAGLGHRAAARQRPHPPVPALRQPGHARLAAATRRPGGQGRRGVDRAAPAQDDHRRRPRLPRRRHHDRRLRARWRLDAHGHGPRWASGPSWATRAWPPVVGLCPRTGWWRCCPPRPRSPRQAPRGWAAHRSSCAAPPVDRRRRAARSPHRPASRVARGGGRAVPVRAGGLVSVAIAVGVLAALVRSSRPWARSGRPPCPAR